MGDFISQTDLEARFQNSDLVALSNLDGSDSRVINDSVITVCISRAEAIIKSYVQTKYTLPFTTVPIIIQSVAEDLSIYYLYERKRALREDLQLLYENAISILKDIANGKVTLDSDPGDNAFQTADTQNLINVEYEEVPFTDAKLEGLT